MTNKELQINVKRALELALELEQAAADVAQALDAFNEASCELGAANQRRHELAMELQQVADLKGHVPGASVCIQTGDDIVVTITRVQGEPVKASRRKLYRAT
jgi:hypothetical protein